MKKDIIYVTGHRHPDSDSIVSAIAYALFKQRKGVHAIACRLGEISPETRYLLERFGFQEPLLFEDARATLGEIDLDEPFMISSQTTIYETLQLMNETGKQAIGVVNARKQILGMVTKSDIASVGLGDTALTIQLLKVTPIAFIAKTISGTLVYDDSNLHFNGKVSVIAISETGLANYELQDRLVIVGNDRNAQLESIRKGAGVLIVVWADSIHADVIALAKKYHCPIIISGHGTMNTTRYLYLSSPVKLIMKKDLISFNQDEFADDVGKKMLKTRYRTYPVVDNENGLCGFVSRYHILDYHNKKVILVDHNEYSQSVNGIEKADLLEVVDHHRICDIVTNRPITFRNEIIGSTTSIIAYMYMEAQMEISKELAGLMLGAVLSDTLKFRSPTTTEKDIGVAKVLANIAEIDIDIFAKEMFKISSNISGKSAASLIRQDIKRFEIDGNEVMIGQVIVSEVNEVHEITAELTEAMACVVREKGLDLIVMAFTSILENGSIFYAAGEKADVVWDAFPNKENELHSFQEDILSRKNQMVPMLSRAMLNYIG